MSTTLITSTGIQTPSLATPDDVAFTSDFRSTSLRTAPLSSALAAGLAYLEQTLRADIEAATTIKAFIGDPVADPSLTSVADDPIAGWFISGWQSGVDGRIISGVSYSADNSLRIPSGRYHDVGQYYALLDIVKVDAPVVVILNGNYLATLTTAGKHVVPLTITSPLNDTLVVRASTLQPDQSVIVRTVSVQRIDAALYDFVTMTALQAFQTLSGSSLVTIDQLAGFLTNIRQEWQQALAAHTARVDPHPQYMLRNDESVAAAAPGLSKATMSTVIPKDDFPSTLQTVIAPFLLHESTGRFDLMGGLASCSVPGDVGSAVTTSVPLPQRGASFPFTSTKPPVVKYRFIHNRTLSRVTVHTSAVVLSLRVVVIQSSGVQTAYTLNSTSATSNGSGRLVWVFDTNNTPTTSEISLTPLTAIAGTSSVLLALDVQFGDAGSSITIPSGISGVPLGGDRHPLATTAAVEIPQDQFPQDRLTLLSVVGGSPGYEVISTPIVTAAVPVYQVDLAAIPSHCGYGTVSQSPGPLNTTIASYEAPAQTTYPVSSIILSVDGLHPSILVTVTGTSGVAVMTQDDADVLYDGATTNYVFKANGSLFLTVRSVYASVGPFGQDPVALAAFRVYSPTLTYNRNTNTWSDGKSRLPIAWVTRHAAGRFTTTPAFPRDNWAVPLKGLDTIELMETVAVPNPYHSVMLNVECQEQTLLAKTVTPWDVSVLFSKSVYAQHLMLSC